MKKCFLTRLSLAMVLVGMTFGAVQMAAAAEKNLPNAAAECPCMEHKDKQTEAMVKEKQTKEATQKTVRKKSNARPRAKVVGRM